MVEENTFAIMNSLIDTYLFFTANLIPFVFLSEQSSTFLFIYNHSKLTPRYSLYFFTQNIVYKLIRHGEEAIKNEME